MNYYTIVDDDNGYGIWSGEAKGLSDALAQMVDETNWDKFQPDGDPDKTLRLAISVRDSSDNCPLGTFYLQYDRP